jgi:Uma2 family endonuclease
VRAPDVAFVTKDRDVVTDKFFEGAPDLAVEVLSPGDLASEVRAKVQEYLMAGSRLV